MTMVWSDRATPALARTDAPRDRASTLAKIVRTYKKARASAGLGTRILWWALPIAAALTGIVVLVKAGLILQQLLGDVLPGQKPYKLHKNALHPGFVSIHVFMSVMALWIGAAQLSASLRAARPRLHRWLGRLYVGFVIPSAGASLVLDPRVDTFGTPFILSAMGVLWLTFTVLGVVAIRQHDVAAHRRWMLRSYGLTFAGGVLFRLCYYVIGMQGGIPIEYSYPASVCIALLTSLLFVEIWLWRSRPRASDPRKSVRLDMARAAT
jgi:uncharacterized membrane protein